MRERDKQTDKERERVEKKKTEGRERETRGKTCSERESLPIMVIIHTMR